MASVSEEAIPGYSWEEWGGEYLVIEEEGTVTATSDTSRQEAAATAPDDVADRGREKPALHRCGSLDSGYEGKLSRTSSPEGKTDQTTAAPEVS